MQDILTEKVKNQTLLRGRFVLRSKQESYYYWDKYRFESDPILLSSLTDELEKLLPSAFDKLAGLELGGVPLATALSLRIAKPCLYVRKSAKTYGTCNLVEGGYSTGEIVVVVEDVVTTGGQVCLSIKQMRELGLIVEHVVCVIDRLQGGRKAIEDVGCTLVSIFNSEGDTLRRVDRI